MLIRLPGHTALHLQQLRPAVVFICCLIVFDVLFKGALVLQSFCSQEDPVVPEAQLAHVAAAQLSEMCPYFVVHLCGRVIVAGCQHDGAVLDLLEEGVQFVNVWERRALGKAGGTSSGSVGNILTVLVLARIWGHGLGEEQALHSLCSPLGSPVVRRAAGTTARGICS